MQFSLDIRSKEDAQLLKLEEALKSEFSKIAAGEDIGGLNTLGTKGRGCSVEWQLDTDSPATKFHEDCVKCVEASAKDMLGTNVANQVQRMTSGAGHDRCVIQNQKKRNANEYCSVYTSRHAPTSM